MDLNKLSRGERIVLIVGAILFVLSFVPLWATQSFQGGTHRLSAWSGEYNFLVKLGLILILAAVAYTGARGAGKAITMPINAGLAYVVAGGIMTLALLIALLTGPGNEFPGSGIDISRGILLYVGIILAAVITYGGYLHMQTETGPVSGRTSPPSPGNV